jgi:phosphonate transport system substrate-binding protein
MKNGLGVEEDCQVSEAVDNKQENVILSVYTGDVDAGFIRESALHQADKFVPPSMIKVINRSAWLPNWALSVKRSLPEEKKKAIKKALIDLNNNNPVIKALKIKSFRAATDEEYDPVREASGIKIPERN